MRKFAYFVSGLVLALYMAIGLQLPVRAATTNLIANPSFEIASGSLPANWNQGGWGSNTRNFSYTSTSHHSGSMSATVNVSNYVSGDAKWYRPGICCA